MNHANKLLIATALIAIGFQSCENEIEINAPYRETGVIYGIVDPGVDTQVVRIQKAFLGEGNALIMAQNPDSVYYPDGVLDVKMYELTPVGNSYNVVDSFPLVRFEGPPKPPGSFPSTPNILYRTNGEAINTSSEYKIVVRNTQTNNVFSAQTPIVQPVNIIRPNTTELIRWASQFPVTVRYNTNATGRVYNLTIRFKFNEENVATGTITPKSIDWVFANRTVTDPVSVSEILTEIEGEKFYKFVDSKLTADPNIRRYAGNLDFIVTVGAEFLANYVDINQPGTNLLTSPPVYSNVVNGTGIFSSRSVVVRADKQMDPPALDELKNGVYTSDLGFQ